MLRSTNDYTNLFRFEVRINGSSMFLLNIGLEIGIHAVVNSSRKKKMGERSELLISP